jgi:U3 small nucleolar RNA-associated protein 6
MHALYAGFLSQQLWPLLAAAEGGDASAVEQVALVGAQLLALLKRACSSADTSCPALGVHWVDWALRLGQPKAAVKAARAACSLWPSNARTWGRRLRLELELLNAKQQPADELFSTLESALKAVPLNAGGTALWDLALQTITPGHTQHPRLVSMFLTSLAAGPRGPLSGGAGAVAAGMLRSVHESQGLEAARKLMPRIAQGPAPGGDYFKAAIQLEESALKSSGGDEKRVRALYEAAAEMYGAEDTQLWLSYALFEQSCKRSAGRIYWRATKALDEPQPFIDQFREVMGSSAEGAGQA